jgi:hypothetical protein
MFITCFLGLTIFLYVSVLVPFTYAVTMVSYICLGYRIPLFEGICWCLYAIPLLDVLLSVNWHIIFSFFRRTLNSLTDDVIKVLQQSVGDEAAKANIQSKLEMEALKDLQGSMSVEAIKEYIKGIFERMRLHPSRWVKCGVWIQMGAICLIAVGVVAGLICTMVLKDENDVIIVTLVISIVAGIVPALAFCQTLASPWVGCLRKTRRKTTVPATPLQLELHDQSSANDGDAPNQSPDTTSSETEENKKFSVLDPCGLLQETEWDKFLDVLLDLYKKRLCRIELWIAVAFGCIQFMYVIVNIVDKTGEPEPKDLLAARFFVNLLMFPFVSLANVTVLFTCWHKLKEQTVLWVVKLISFVFMVIVIVLLITVTILVKAKKPFIRAELDYIPPKYQNVTSGSMAPFCHTTADMWSIMQLAGLLMAADHLETGHNDVPGPSSPTWPALHGTSKTGRSGSFGRSHWKTRATKQSRRCTSPISAARMVCLRSRALRTWRTSGFFWRTSLRTGTITL